MNNIVRKLMIAAPLATAALTMVPGAAQAADSPQGTHTKTTVVDPCPEPGPRRGDCDPDPDPCPVPGGPRRGEHCDEPGNPGGGGGDNPGGGGNPGDGPGGVITNPEPCPTHGECPGNPGDGGGDGGGNPGDNPGDGNGGGDPDGGKGGSGGNGGRGNGAGGPSDQFVTPTRIDAGFGPVTNTPDDGGMNLTFVLVGGALVSASGAAFAARARRSQA